MRGLRTWDPGAVVGRRNHSIYRVIHFSSFLLCSCSLRFRDASSSLSFSKCREFPDRFYPSLPLLPPTSFPLPAGLPRLRLLDSSPSLRACPCFRSLSASPECLYHLSPYFFLSCLRIPSSLLPLFDRSCLYIWGSSSFEVGGYACMQIERLCGTRACTYVCDRPESRGFITYVAGLCIHAGLLSLTIDVQPVCVNRLYHHMFDRFSICFCSVV